MTKTEILKIFALLRKKTWRNSLALMSKKMQGIFSKMFILALMPSAQISSNLLCLGDKTPFRVQSSLEIMNISPNIFAKTKFQKTETQFFRHKSNDYNNINIFLSLENPCNFLLAIQNTWKHIFNVITTKSYRKNKFYHSKQH